MTRHDHPSHASVGHHEEEFLLLSEVSSLQTSAGTNVAVGHVQLGPQASRQNLFEDATFVRCRPLIVDARAQD